MASPCTPRCATPHDVPGLRGWRHVDPRRWVRAPGPVRRNQTQEPGGVVEERAGVYVVIIGGVTMRPSRVVGHSHATAEDAMRAAEVRRG